LLGFERIGVVLVSLKFNAVLMPDPLLSPLMVKRSKYKWSGLEDIYNREGK
jgi:hypothetical protein